ncbi:hypothetical protein HWV62_24233 [Athelia sp. TMB]|nr:hypothetical protein HWV62_24233 [Athelia sp. TMB]
MALSQYLFNNHPLFRLADDPFSRPSSLWAQPRSIFDDPFFHPTSIVPHSRSLFDSPFFHPSNIVRPSLDVTEQDGNYVIQAHLPGVKKENLDVHVGDAGRSVTIEGKTFRKYGGGTPTEGAAAAPTNAGAADDKPSDSTAAVKRDSGEVAASKSTEENTEYNSFSRTVWLPRAVDGRAVSAKLADGVLTLTVPKAVDKESVKINIE